LESHRRGAFSRKRKGINELKNVHVLPLDVTNAESLRRTIEKAISLSPIDVVINNAGYGLVGPFESYPEDQVEKQINTNLTGVLRVAQKNKESELAYLQENSSS
jgi:NAD(P)-dependent dehydrogenase (short-subunit alcohol dehydrogenase family)